MNREDDFCLIKLQKLIIFSHSLLSLWFYRNVAHSRDPFLYSFPCYYWFALLLSRPVSELSLLWAPTISEPGLFWAPTQEYIGPRPTSKPGLLQAPTHTCIWTRFSMWLVVWLTYFSTLKTEAVQSSETSLNFYQTTWHHITERTVLTLLDIKR
jgi:hypothetical protein